MNQPGDTVIEKKKIEEAVIRWDLYWKFVETFFVPHKIYILVVHKLEMTL